MSRYCGNAPTTSASPPVFTNGTHSDAANKKLKTAIRQAERHPNSQNKSNQLENAKNNVKQIRANQVRAKMINSTIGKYPEKSKIIINSGVNVIKDNKNEK